jgi:hypothetical protein
MDRRTDPFPATERMLTFFKDLWLNVGQTCTPSIVQTRQFIFADKKFTDNHLFIKVSYKNKPHFLGSSYLIALPLPSLKIQQLG